MARARVNSLRLEGRARSLAFLFLALMFTFITSVPALAGYRGQPQRSQRTQSRKTSTRVPAKAKVDYAKFSHQTHAVTQKLACNSCHKVPSKNFKDVRKGDAVFPDVTDFPEHSSCLNCHREQFFARERPAPTICSNCHIAISPRDTARWLFPSLGDLTDPKLKRREFVSEFGVGFPHDKHLDVVGFNERQARTLPFVEVSFQKKPGPPKSCPVCHETYRPQGNSSEEYVTKPPRNLGDSFWLKKGTFKTIPNSHTICFTCHNADSGIAPEPKDCNSCHKFVSRERLKVDYDPKLSGTMGITDKMILDRWARRISSGTFRHEGGEHPDVSCLNCHNVSSANFNPAEPKSTKVSVRSCGGADGCHVTATVDDGGALNFELDSRKKDPKFVCTKCHVTFGTDPFPENHPQAIPTPKPKTKAS
jgi:Cytochrome c7 and related cytochrome c